MSPRLSTLAEIEAAVWRELAAAPRDKQHPWRMPVLATTDGEFGDARLVVIREARPPEQRLLVYTDRRSGKVAQLRAHPIGTLAMWSPALNWQLRCRVQVSLETSGLDVSSRWARIKLSPGAQDYLSPLPPGTDLADDGAVHTPVPTGEERGALSYFAVMDMKVLSLDWLELHPDGQRRAIFGDGGGRWVQP